MTNQPAKDFICSVYEGISNASVSAEARRKSDVYSDSVYVYGDTDLDSLQQMIEYMEPKPGAVFYDLGSGGGRVVLYAALSFAFSKCTGVELIEDLVKHSNTMLNKFNQKLPEASFLTQPFNTQVGFVNDDFTKIDLRDADIIYTYSTCFDYQLMGAMAEHLDQQVKPGTKIITVTKSLPSSKFKLLKEDKHMMEWGQATTWFYEKI